VHGTKGAGKVQYVVDMVVQGEQQLGPDVGVGVPGRSGEGDGRGGGLGAGRDGLEIAIGKHLLPDGESLVSGISKTSVPPIGIITIIDPKPESRVLGHSLTN
jgi:hypothetical protein